jgi:hypothetical protein
MIGFDEYIPSQIPGTVISELTERSLTCDGGNYF